MAPPLFRALEVDDAIQAAKTEARLLLIDFTADWCAPCQQMDAVVWVAPEVARWVEQNAIAIQVDVEERPEDAKRFGIQSMPTMVLMRDGAEVDRSGGARPAAKLISWLENAKQGRTEIDTTRESLPDDDPSAWFHLGRMLAARGRFDEALEQFERCWLRGLEKEPAWYGVRLSYLIGELEQLAGRSPHAQERIRSWRDAAEKRRDEPDGLRDWLALNGALGDDERVLAWFDAIEKPKDEPIDLARDRRVVSLLISHGRWADYGRLLRSPIEHLAERVSMYREDVPFDKMPPEAVAEVRAHAVRAIREEARCLLKALRAADRSDDASQLEAKALELDPTDEMRDALATT